MHFSSIIAVSLPILGALSAPHSQSTCMSFPRFTNTSNATTQTTAALSLTLTITLTHTYTATAATTTCTSSGPITSPTSKYGIITARSGSPVHLLPMNAAGLRFYLGGEPATYCPGQVKNCPPGKYTGFAGLCSLDVEVPGGQQIYVAPDGSIGYTQAHSSSRPSGANLCPFTYTKPEGNTYGYIGLNPALAFGATSFMGCPTTNGIYQLFANINNATVPQGDVSKCLGFQALAPEYTGSPAAWQYT